MQPTVYPRISIRSTREISKLFQTCNCACLLASCRFSLRSKSYIYILNKKRGKKSNAKMETYVRNVNDSVNTTTTEAYMLTSEISITAEEEDAIVTLVIIVIGIIIAIMVLFSMGIFIDCKHQKKRKLRLKMPSLEQKKRKDEVKTLASNMCPNASYTEFNMRDAIV